MTCALSATCEEPAVDGRKGCVAHLAKRREYQMAWQRKNRAAGLCTSCSSPALPGLSRCGRHRVHDPNRWRDQRLQQRYGISEREYEALFVEQSGVCRICKRPERFKSSGAGIKNLAVDHDHDTGEVRGLLCNNCNRAIGLFDDNPALLLRATEYLSGLVN